MSPSATADQIRLARRDRLLGATLLMGAIAVSGASLLATTTWAHADPRASRSSVHAATDSSGRETICQWRMRSHWPAGS